MYYGSFEELLQRQSDLWLLALVSLAKILTVFEVVIVEYGVV